MERVGARVAAMLYRSQFELEYEGQRKGSGSGCWPQWRSRGRQAGWLGLYVKNNGLQEKRLLKGSDELLPVNRGQMMPSITLIIVYGGDRIRTC